MPPADQPELFPAGDAAPPAPRRHFLSWDRPLLEQAADWLLGRAGDRLPIDLSHLLVIVPTRNAGRRFREMLANLADARGTAVSPPLAAPPTILIRPQPGASGLPVASELEATAAWIAVLERTDLGSLRALFPVDPPEQDFTWARGTARDLGALKRTLGEAGLGFGDVLKRLPEGHEDTPRWQDLAALEERWRQYLEKTPGRIDREPACARAARQARLPEGIREVIVLGTPDPMPLAVDALESLVAAGVPVTVAIYAPDSLSEAFDAWGRPRAETWLRETIDLPDFFGSVQVVANPDGVIERVLDLAEAIEHPAETLAIGAVDADMAPLLESALQARGIPAFDPEGSRVNQEGFHHFLKCLTDLLSRPRFDAAVEFLRIPVVEGWLATTVDHTDRWQSTWGLRAIDECHARHLPDSLSSLRHFLDHNAAEQMGYALASAAISRLEELIADLNEGPLAERLPTILREIFASLPLLDESDRRWTEKTIEAAAPVLMRDLAQLDGFEDAGLKWTAADRMSLLLDNVGDVALSEDRPSGAIELQGWLELLWEDAPHLVIAGLNDGIVPEAIVGDAFLPDNLRSLRTLRLKTNDERFVRDIYLLRALVESRRESGRLDILVPKTNTDGEPRRPSRLLFRCSDADLPARVAHLFREVELSGIQTSWSPGFALVPGLPRAGEPEKVIERISVTDFSQYLRSPFHYWAQRLRRLAEIDPGKAEMDALDFGNFCHAVLECYGTDDQARTWTDASRIAAYFDAKADEIALASYGRHPGLAIRMQIEAAKRRLAAAAEAEAAARRDGWEIIAVEARIHESYPLPLGGIEVVGKIDRIERRGDTIRVLDFKTVDSPKNPKRDHFVENRLGDEPEWPPPYAFFDYLSLSSNSSASAQPKRYRFHNLQLPLYALALSGVYRDQEIHCGYFQLAKAASDVKPETWVVDQALLDAAKRCAEGVIADVLAGQFGRIRPMPQNDPLTPWHLGVPERTLDLTHLGGGREHVQTS
ncbi:MAG: PD-(D/E)XK nuclease family protein [Verrucomicrobiales bacterium]|nr:PD-(D/E)XK nuclease family protein [Verrucomicrobiales bacterium]